MGSKSRFPLDGKRRKERGDGQPPIQGAEEIMGYAENQSAAGQWLTSKSLEKPR